MQQRKSKDSHANLTRRDFHRLTVAALGGAASGSFVFQHALGKSPESELLKEPHVCCGLNTCKGHGKGNHECAGQGSCATDRMTVRARQAVVRIQEKTPVKAKAHVLYH